MTKIVIITHGYLAKGLRDSLEFILGKQQNLMAIPAYTKLYPEIKSILDEIISEGDDVLFATDVFGGSVNNEIMARLKNNPQIRLVCGVNLPFLIQLFNSLLSVGLDPAIDEAMKAAKNGIKNCRDISRSKSEGFDSF